MSERDAPGDEPEEEAATGDDAKPAERDESLSKAKAAEAAVAGDAEPTERKESRSKPEEKARGAASPREARSAKANRPRSRDDKLERRISAGRKTPVSRTVLVAVVAVVALAAGAAGGWFGHDARAKAALRAESTPEPAGSGAAPGPCAAWEKQICASSGDESVTCQQAKGATDLLTTSACEAALEVVPATLAKVKAARVPCENLVAKLCKDLPQGSPTCKMVTERTTAFPGDRCTQMLENYDQVVSEVKMIEQQGGMQPGAAPHGAPPVSMPPGAMPQGAMPQGAHP